MKLDCEVEVKYFNVPSDDQKFDSNDSGSKPTPHIYFYCLESCDKTDGNQSRKFYFFNFYIFYGFSSNPINCGDIFPHLKNNLILPNHLGKYKFCHQIRKFLCGNLF